MPATLTTAALGKLFLGCSKIKLAPVGALTATTFDSADEIFTTKDSISISQGSPTKTEIKVDQFDSPIASTYEKGDFTISATLPTIAKEILEYFFKDNDPTTPVNITGFTYNTGVDLDVKIITCQMLLISKDGTASIVIPKCEIVANFNGDGSNNTAPLSIQLTCTPIANLTSGTGGTVLFYGKTA